MKVLVGVKRVIDYAAKVRQKGMERFVVVLNLAVCTLQPPLSSLKGLPASVAISHLTFRCHPPPDLIS